MRSIRLVVFDLDGTLVDTSRDLTGASNQLVASYGGRPLHMEQVGEGTTVLVRRALAAAGVPEMPADAHRRFLEIYDRILLDETRPYEGVPEMLAYAALQARLAVLTNKPRAAAVRILDGLNLTRYLYEVVGGDGPHGRKPVPAGLFHLIARAPAAPDETLLVGDSVVDLDTAKQAGVAICLARYGFGFPRIPPYRLSGDEATIAHPAELAGIISGSRADH
jgi:phosphoglycolate phosphatase